ADLGLTQRMDGALELIGKGRRIEVPLGRTRFLARTPYEPLLAGEIDEKTLGRSRNGLELDLSAPRAKLRACPIELGWGPVPGIELLHQQHVDVFLLRGPLHCPGARAWQ